LSDLVRKNLSGHSRRNIKTAVMFTTSLAFIIFAGSSFSLQGYTIQSSFELAGGADIVIFGPPIGKTRNLNEVPMREFLKKQMAQENPIVLGYTFTTPPLRTSLNYIRSTRISNLAGFPFLNVAIYSVEENYLMDTYDKFYQPTEISNQFSYSTTRDGKKDVIKSLYVDAGKAQLPQEIDGIQIPPEIQSGKISTNNISSTTEKAYIEYIDVVVSEALRLTASVDIKTPLKLLVSFTANDQGANIFYLCKLRAMVRQMPGFLFSSYRQTAFSTPLIVSMEQYYRMMKETYETSARDFSLPDVPPKNKLQVRLKSNPSFEEREKIINGLRNFINDDLIQVLDTNDVIGSTQVALDILTLFFNLVSVIAVILCFFVLWLSFTANVNENAWEFGVLRALGLNASRVVRMYIYEAMCIILSSVILGGSIGLLISVTLTLQFLLFTELEFVFNFPYTLFFSVLGMSLLVSILGSYLPSRIVMKKPIAIALKNM